MILAALVSLIGGFAVLVVTLMLRYDMGRYALSILIITVMALTIVTLIYRSDKQLHVHHWVVAIILCSFLCYKDYVVLGLHGLLNGVMIEGIARWGLDPVWELKNE